MPSPWPEIATALAVLGASARLPAPHACNAIAVALDSGRPEAQACALAGRQINAGVGLVVGALGASLLSSMAGPGG